MVETNRVRVGDLIAIFLFYNFANGKQAKLAFSKDFQHCNSIVYDGEFYILVEYDQEGIKVKVIKAKRLSTLIRHLKVIPELTAIICAEVFKRKKINWKPWWVRSCNELCRYTAGIDVGFTFNPVHLYNRLLRYKDKRNYVILDQWRR